MQKKARLVGLRKFQGVPQIARLKQQRSLSFTFRETRKSCDLTTKSCVFIYFIDSVVKIVLSEAATGRVLYKKVFLKFKKFTGKHKARISFLINLQAPLTSLLIILTWKSLNILYRKLTKFLKVLAKENLKSACKRHVLQQCCRSAILLKRYINTDVFLWIFQDFLNSFFIEQLQWLLLSYVLVSKRPFNKES